MGRVRKKKVLTVGGTADGYPLDKWPHFKDVPLAYLGRVVAGKSTYFIFLDGPNNEVEDSWQAQDGSNAVICLSDGIVNVPAWITALPVSKPVERLTEAHEVPIPAEPGWLQGDESQEGFTFTGQIDSDLDDNLSVGDAHGVAYVFINDSTHEGRLVWQA